MNIVGQRLRLLRTGMKLTQTQMAGYIGMGQSSINRYESGDADPPFSILLKYADYFDVSLDYIFGRTDNPQGKMYAYYPHIEKTTPEMEKFIEMCFEPSSPMKRRLKETLFKMLKEVD